MNKTLGLILALSITISASAQELVDETKHTNISDAVDNVSVLITEVPNAGTGIITLPVASTSESSPKALEDPLQPEGVPLVPPQNTVADTASESATAGSSEASSSEGDKELSFFDKIYNYLMADEDSIKAKALLMKKKMEYRSKYGDDANSVINFTTLSEVEAAMDAAEEVRRQRQLELEIAEANRQKLYNESLECLALNGYHEARGETADQEVATAAVVLNRLSVGFRGATTVCEVIYTPKQFSWVEQIGRHTPDTSNKVERQAWERSLLIARRMLDPDATFIDPSNGALYYYNPSIVDWKYKHAYVQVAVLGSHRFMTEPTVTHPHRIDNTQVRVNPVLFNGLSHDERNALLSNFQNKVGE